MKIEKQLLYDRHTLEDNYEYRKVERSFQWDKIAGMIDSLLNFENQAKEFGALSNYKNRNGPCSIVGFESERRLSGYRR